MDSIWFRFSVETIMTGGDGCKVRPKSQGENQHGAKQIDRVALPSAGLARRSFLEVLSKKTFSNPEDSNKPNFGTAAINPVGKQPIAFKRRAAPYFQPVRSSPRRMRSTEVFCRSISQNLAKFRCVLVAIEGCDRTHNRKLLEHVVRARNVRASNVRARNPSRNGRGQPRPPR